MPALHDADLWVFGYGSLMWRPDFPFVERCRANIAGFHRAFCIRSTMHRGTRERPGLVLGLDRGRSCEGIAYRVAAKDAPSVLAYLRRRELIYGVYRESRIMAALGDGASAGQAMVLAYTAERNHPSYMRRLPLEATARVIRAAKGESGANLDYLINTVQHMMSMGIRERELERLMAVAARHTAARETSVPHRAGVAGLLGVWSRSASADLRVPLGDQRRFGHRIRLHW